MAASISNLTTRCIGRYLIDMPVDSAMFDFIRIDGVTIEATAMSLNDYHKAMQARSKELNSTKAWYGYRFLYADTVIEGIPESRYFVSLGAAQPLTDAERVIEAYRWDNGHQIKMQIKASSAKDSIEFKDDPSVRDDPDMTDVSAKAQRVVSLLSHASGRSNEEIPATPGVCFRGGFLAGPPWEKENIFAQFVLNEHQDVSFDFNSDSDIREQTTLLQRSNDIARDMKEFDGKTIRKGPVHSPDMPAEEWLMSGITVLNTRGYLFSLEANSTIGSPKTPLVSLDMNVGMPNRQLRAHELDKVSLDESESLALWDAVSRTLRPRPNAAQRADVSSQGMR